jgi:rod shape-determining protein MreD
MVNKTINFEYVFAIIFALFFQIIVAPRISIAGVTVDMALIVSLWIALVKPPRTAMLFGFACGAFVGIVSPSDFGWAALLLAFFGLGLATLKEKLVMESMPLRFLMLLIFSFAYNLVFLSLSRFAMLGGDFGYIFLQTLFTSLYTTGVGILTFIFIQNRYIIRNMF